jgi:hydrogenase nickel incorporation protein HypB
MQIKVVRDLLEANERIAAENRTRFDSAKVRVVNLMSAPGAGKTTLLERTIAALSPELKIGVVEGDIQTSRDAERIEAAGAVAVQVNTEGACHLDANMIAGALGDLPLEELDLLIIENVGNLVCPAEFNVGEHVKAMVLSLAEGDDKPSKYPLMFRESKALVINKMDLAPHVDADAGRIEEDSKKINPELTIIRTSCRTGEGIDAWVAWLRAV